MTTHDLPLETVAARLGQAIRHDVGMNGLNIMLHGWIHATGTVSGNTLRTRKARDGQAWLTPLELASFSRYVGYDLAQNPNPRNPDPKTVTW